MRTGGKLFQRGLLLILLPLISQLVFVAIVWSCWNQPASAASDLLQRKVILGAATYFILLAATMALIYYDAIMREAKRHSDNVRHIAEGEREKVEPVHIEEYLGVEKHFQELEHALKLAVVAAHEGKESRSAEMRLRLHEERMRLIVSTVPVGLMVIDSKGAIESSNPAAQAMFMLDAKELAGRRFRDFFQIDTTDGASEFMAELALMSGAKPKDLKGRRPNGGIFPLELTVQMFEAIEGNRFLVLLVDVTERHEVERLKQEFVAMVSHELRTPLTSVGAFLEMLVLGTFDADLNAMKNRSETAGRNVARLIDLVNNLLDLEKMQQGRFDFRVTIVHSQSVMRKAIDSVQELAQQHGVNIESNDCVLEFDGDEERLMQVIINLLSNAIKFSNPGETVRLTTVEKGDFVEISVEDSGPGIPAGAEAVIFEKYRQALQPGANRPKGTGLGLPLCKAIVEQHGGTIGVDSSRPKGSRFWFNIPKVVDPGLLKALR